jgi:hypothetical protein
MPSPKKASSSPATTIINLAHIIATDDTKLGRLQNLRGPLAQYNGNLVTPKGSLQGGYIVELEKDGSLQLEVRSDMLEVVPNYDVLCGGAQRNAKHKGAGASELHGSVQNCIDRVSAELRKSIAAKLGKEIRDDKKALKNAINAEMRATILAFDQDSNGMITREEFKNSLKFHNVTLSDTDILTVWQVFDTNGDGELDMDEFSGFVGALLPGGHRRGSLIHAQGVRLKEAHKLMRFERCIEKTKIKALLEQLVGILKAQVQWDRAQTAPPAVTALSLPPPPPPPPFPHEHKHKHTRITHTHTHTNTRTHRA